MVLRKDYFMKYLSIEEIKQAFAKHMMKYRGYTSEEAEIAVSDFPDPYSNCYLDEKYIGSCWINGVEYDKYASNTDLWRVAIHNVPNFFFYAYESADGHKLYQVDDLEVKDFPLMENEKDFL
jgi:hypothetical protein